MYHKFTLISVFFLLIFDINSQTIGNTIYKLGNQDGYILFSPLNSKSTFLIDKCGRTIQQWSSDFLPGVSCKLGNNGKLYRTGNISNEAFLNGGGNGGLLEIFSFNGKKEATYYFSDTKQVQHHDIYVMNNGNILLILWQIKSKDECLAKGKDTAQMAQISSNLMWFEKVIEIRPKDSTNYDIVWEWEAFDHIVQDKYLGINTYNSVHLSSERIDINYNPNNNPQNNFIHINSIDYNEDLDQIVLSARLFDEIWVIDHSTTTAEAKTNNGGKSGKGGGIIYRWGNAFAYKSANLIDRKLFKQHHAHWIKNNTIHKGNIIIFNNGIGRNPVNFSSVDIIVPPKNDSNYNKQLAQSYEA